MELPPFGRWCMYLVLAFPIVRQCGAQIRTIPCPRGSFGSPDCGGTCHCHNGNEYCRWEDGRCTDGKCSYGWTNPPTCQAGCPNGMFGLNCSHICHCPPNDVCDSINGLCSSNQCLLGWGGPSCQNLLPVLVNPPDVTSTTESQVTLSWPKWITGQTGRGVGTVISHTLQQLDNQTKSWQNVVNLEDSSALMRFTYTVVNLRPNTAYKYRIRLVMDDSHKPLPSVPSPESARWIVTSCSAPSDPPTNVTAQMIENQQTYIRVTWMPPSLGSMNCNGLARHEIFIACIRPCVSLTASEEWPANVSIIQYFYYTNYTIDITVRAINDAGHAGPLSVPFHIFLPVVVEASPGVTANPTGGQIFLPVVDHHETAAITTSITKNGTTAGVTEASSGVVANPTGGQIFVPDVDHHKTAAITTNITRNGTAGVTEASSGVIANPAGGQIFVPDVDHHKTAAITTSITRNGTAGVTEASSGVIANPAGGQIFVPDVDQHVTAAITTSMTTSGTAGVTTGRTAGVTTGRTAGVTTVTTAGVTTGTTAVAEARSFVPGNPAAGAITVVPDVTAGLTASRRLGETTASQEMISGYSSEDVTTASTPDNILRIFLRREHRVILELHPGIENVTGVECKINVDDLDNNDTWVVKQCHPGRVFDITDLLPATKYKITVMFNSSDGEWRRYSIVLYTAPPPPPSPPTPVVSDVSDTSFTVTVTTKKRSANIVFLRLVVIEKLESEKSHFQDAVDSRRTFPFEDSRSTLKEQHIMVDVTTAQRLNFPFYVTGAMNSSGDPFVVGDGQTYQGFSNVPLEPNTTYMVWFVWENSLDGITHRMASQPAGPVLTEVAPPPEGGLSVAMIVLIVLCVLLFFIILLIIIIVLFWRRAKINRLTKVEIVHAPYRHPEPSPVNRNLAASYLLSSVLIPRSAQKDFDAISGADGDYVIPDACVIYECSGSSISRSCPVPVQKLRDFCSQYLFVDSGSLEEQFILLPNCFTDSVNVAWLTCNAIQNRSPQAVPYDRNRVKLKHGLPQSSAYINASFVRTIGRRYCIVTQCPTLSTLGHFWQMVWERGTSTIVMLMDSEAPDSLNFDCYWPEMLGRYHAYDGIHVELVSVNTFANYSVRHFKIGEVNAVRERHVFHWQYLSWSKGGVPEHPITFLSFVKRIREERKSDTGFLVHCRTGGGRSGVYVAVDTLLTQGLNTGVVDVLRLVTLLRAERSNLVKSFVQYRFIYECLCEEFDHNPSRYLAERFVMTFEGLESSETALKTLTYEQQVMVQLPVYTDSLTRSLVSRKSMLLEASMTDPNALEEDDDLNDLDPYPFQTLSGFIKRDMFIASCCISATYCDEFWHSITDNRVNCIVMLNKRADLLDAKHLLPQMDESVNSKHFSILCTSVKASPSNIYVAYNLKVRLRHVQEEVGTHNVRLFEFTKWPRDDEAPAVAEMLELLEQLRQWLNRYSANRPVLLFSGCGIGKSRAALLMVLWYVLEQSEKEGILDIFSTSRLIRSYIVSSMDHEDHYHFMYLAVRDFLKRNLAYYTLPVESKDRQSPTYRPGWTSPTQRHSTSGSRTTSRRGQSSVSELPPETGQESPKARLRGQKRTDPLRRNLYNTDLEEAEKEPMTVTDKGNNPSRMSADRTKMQIYTPEYVEKPAQQRDFRSGFVSPLEDEQERALANVHNAGQNSDLNSKPSASQSKSGQKNPVEFEEQHPEALPRPRARGSSAAKKTDANGVQGGEASTSPRRTDSGHAEYATVMKPRKSSSQRMQQYNSDSTQMAGNDKTASSKTNSPK